MSYPPNAHLYNQDKIAKELKKAAQIQEIEENCYSSVKDPVQRREFAENAYKRGPACNT